MINPLLWKFQGNLEEKQIWEWGLAVCYKRMGIGARPLAEKFYAHFSTSLHGFLSAREVKTRANTECLFIKSSVWKTRMSPAGWKSLLWGFREEKSHLSPDYGAYVWCLLWWLMYEHTVIAETDGRSGHAGSSRVHPPRICVLRDPPHDVFLPELYCILINRNILADFGPWFRGQEKPVSHY